MAEASTGDSSQPLVFVSYSRANAAFVERLIADLADRGITCWFDRTHIKPGDPDWDEAIRAAIRASQGVVLVATPESRQSPHVKGEIDLARRYERIILPVWAQGDVWIDSVALSLSTAQYIDARGDHYSEALDRLVGVMTAANATPAPVVLVPEPDFEPRNPYKGLHAFGETDAPDFYGRERLVADLIARLGAIVAAAIGGEPSRAARLLAVVGPSGSGKSSLVQAGLLPRLRTGGISAGERWLPSSEWIYLRPVKPGAHPGEVLAGALSAALHRSVTEILKDLGGDSSRGLHLLARVLAHNQDQHVVMVVDQFEELFTQADPASRQHFLDLLVTAVTEPVGPVLAVLTLRSDFYHYTMAYPDLWPAVQANTVFVTPMGVEDLRNAIVGPALQADTKLAFEKDLVGDLLFEIRDQEGALPLLQFTLDKLFERRVGHRLTQAAYDEIGRVHGALARHADSVFETVLTNEQQGVAASLFMRLVDLDSAGQDVSRRRMPFDELEQADPARSRLLLETADAYVRARLLVVDVVRGVRSLDLAHEALISAWPRLRQWIQDNRAGLVQHRQIIDDAARWERGDRDESLLYRGSRLAAALAWRDEDDHAATLSRTEATFLVAGGALRDRDEQLERQREQREIAAAKALANSERRRANIARTFAAVLGAALAAMVVVAIIALQQRALATRESQEARSRALAASALAQLQTDPELSLLLAAEAARTDATAEAVSALRESLVASHVRLVDRANRGAVTSAAFSPAGNLVITGDDGGRVRIWAATTGATVFQSDDPTGAPVLCVAFSADSSLAAWGGADDRAHVLDVHTHAEVANLPNADIVTSVAFSPDSRQLVSSDISGAVTVWNARMGRSLAVLQGTSVGPAQASFSPRGDTLLVLGPDEDAHLWRWADAKDLHTFSATGTNVDAAAFVASGTRIATGHSDGTTRIWDARTGNLLTVLVGHAGDITSIAAFPASTQFVTTGVDGTARLWDAASGRLLHVLAGHIGKVLQAAVSGDGRLVATAGVDDTVKIWDAGTGLLLATLAGHKSTITSLSFDPRTQDQAVLTSSTDGTVRIWDVSTYATLNPSLWSAPSLSAEAWSPDGALVATAGAGSGIQIRTAASGAILRVLNAPSLVSALQFSANGRLLASIVGGIADIWTVADGRLSAIVPAGGHVVSVAFSPDSKSIALVLADHEVSLWSAQATREQVYRGAPEPVGSIGAFSPDGSLLATIGVAGRLAVWDTRSGTLLYSPSGIVSGVWFSPDGKWLLRVTKDLLGGLWYARLCDARSGTGGKTIDEDTSQAGDDVTAAIFADNGSAIFTARNSGLICESTGPSWPMATCDLADHAGAVTGLAVDASGAFLATASADGSARVWERATEQLIALWSNVPGSATGLAFGANNLVETVRADGASQSLAAYACRVCGSVQDLLSLAQKRVTRQLTVAERAQYVQSS